MPWLAASLDEVRGARGLNWPEPPFLVPADIRDMWREAGRAGRSRSTPGLGARRKRCLQPAAAEFERRIRGEVGKDKIAAQCSR
jgi:hypothetical protein